MSRENPLLRRSEDVKKYVVSYSAKLYIILRFEFLDPLFGPACVGHGS